MLNQTDYGSVANFLASEHKIVLGGTIDSSLITTTDKYLEAGTVLGKVTATGKLAVYDNTQTDGRETAVGILMEPVVAEEDVMVTYMVHGAVIESKLTSYDVAAKTDLPHIIFV